MHAWFIQHAGFGSAQRAWSNAYWSAWIFVMFLVPELLAATGAVPLHTLSHTAWLDEQTYPMLRVAIAGFLLGLALHICTEADLARAVAGGEVMALSAHYLWGMSV